MWMDLANHIVRLWDHYKLAAATCSPTNVYPERWAPLDAACKTWWDGSRQTRELVARMAAQQEVATDDAARGSS